MDCTRSRRYANHKSRKIDGPVRAKKRQFGAMAKKTLLETNPVKAESAAIFTKYDQRKTSQGLSTTAETAKREILKQTIR